jgi:hypothetical protein
MKTRILAMMILAALLAVPAGRSASLEREPVSTQPDAVVSLAADGACHTQGITIMDNRLFASCVDRLHRRAMIYSWPLPEGFPAGVSELSGPMVKNVTAGAMYHPSGLDHDEQCVWVAVAHYRAAKARAKVMCLDPDTLAERSSFPVDDHIGTLAVMGETIVGWNWDAKKIYRFTKDGRPLGVETNPAQVSYQDCKGVSENKVLCNGPLPAPGQDKPAAVELLSFDGAAWSVSRLALIASPGVSLGNEGFSPWVNYWLFLPEDFPHARLLIYPRPQ